MNFSQSIVSHEQCPKCALIGKDTNKDNFGVFADGGKWCIACGHFEPSKGLNVGRLALAHTTKQEREKNKNDNLSLPSDYTVDLPKIAWNWLKFYGITDEEIDTHKIGWSEQYKRLIFPVFAEGNLLMYQGRSFDLGHSKYHTGGFPEKVFHILGDTGGDELVVVEDIVSAIKVSRQNACLPLWGSVLSTKRLVTLSDLFPRLLIWLDHDKQEYAIKRGAYAKPLFKEGIRVIVSEYDPKVYGDAEILNFITGDA